MPQPITYLDMVKEKINKYNKNHDPQTGRFTYGPGGSAHGSISADSSGRKLSKEQASYFKNSKCRDAEGNLQVMYHGSVEDFDAFEKEKIRAVDYDAPFNGFWFSSDIGTSPAMMNARYTKEVYLDVQNPAPQEVWRKVVKEVDADIQENGVNGVRYEARSSNDEVRYRLQDMGYDGIRWEGRPNIDWNAFESNGHYTYQDARGRYYTIARDKEWGGIDIYSGKNISSESFLTGYYDRTDFENLHSEEVWVVFEPAQIKSTDNKTPSRGNDSINKHNIHHGPDGRFTNCDGSCRSGKGGSAGGSDSSGGSGSAKGRATAAQEKTLSDIGNKIRNLDHEELYAVDSDGNIVARGSGDDHSVSFGKEGVEDGNIVIHNHPPGGTFSAADMSGFDAGAIELRVSAAEGDYRMTKVSDDSDLDGMVKALEADHRKMISKSTRDARQAVIDNCRSDYDKSVMPYKDKYDKASAAFMEHDDIDTADAYDKAKIKYNDALNKWNERHEAEFNEYSNQYVHESMDDWYRNNASKYGFEYEFTPSGVKKSVKSCSYGPSATEGIEEEMKEACAAAWAKIRAEITGEPAEMSNEFQILKSDDDKRLIFGWGSVAIDEHGEQLVDYQGDMIDPDELEEAAYEYVLNFRDTGEEHIPSMRKKGKLVESVVLTREKQEAMGIPEGILPIGWWVGFKIHDPATWALIKSGKYRMFSIEGKAERVPVEKKATFLDNIAKYNKNHDPQTGRFTYGAGGPKGSGKVSANKYKELYPKDSYINSPTYKKLGETFRNSWKESDDAYNRKKELEEQLKGYNKVDKPRDQWTFEDEVDYEILGVTPKMYEGDGEKIKAQIEEETQKSIEAMNKRDVASNSMQEIKERAHREQMAEVSFDKPRKATKDSYEGFKTDDTGVSYYNDLMDGNYANSKGLKTYTAEMSPKEYIQRCAYEIFEGGTMESTLGAVDTENLAKYTEAMSNGTKFNTPYLNYADGGQEGRHRALAAYNNGIETIPVLIVEENTAKSAFVAKYNHNHDPQTGRFTNAPGGTGSSSSSSGKSPGRVFSTPYGVEVVQNPTNYEYRQMYEDVSEKYPFLQPGEPRLRHTYDLDGNEYVWSAMDAIHTSVEPYINERYNTKTHQQHEWWKKESWREYVLNKSVKSTFLSLIQKFNENHDPQTGRFTYGPGGPKGGSGGGSMKNNHGETLSAGQSAYFAKSQVVDENGNLIEVYHGTVHEFTAFDTDMANPENDMGQGIYFSDNDYDVDANYASEDGPDLQAKMDRYEEMLENEGMDPDEAEAKARETFITAEPNTLNCYLNMENPVRLGGDKETFFDFDSGYDPDTDEYGEESGLLVDYYNEVRDLAYDGKYDVYDPESFLQSVGEKLFSDAYDGGISANDAIKAVKEASFDYVNIENQYGDYVTGGNELAREALENMGYDGIIDKTVGQKFRGMTNMTSDTTHYIIFDSNQAKLVDNQNPTSDPNINKSKEGRKMSGYKIYKLNKAEQAIVNALTQKCWDGEKRDFSRLDAADRNILTGLLEKAGRK